MGALRAVGTLSSNRSRYNSLCSRLLMLRSADPFHPQARFCYLSTPQIILCGEICFNFLLCQRVQWRFYQEQLYAVFACKGR